jgi:hypothetical protein
VAVNFSLSGEKYTTVKTTPHNVEESCPRAAVQLDVTEDPKPGTSNIIKHGGRKIRSIVE